MIPPDPDQLLALLVPFDWKGLATCVTDSLWEDPEAPRIAFGADAEDHIGWLTEKAATLYDRSWEQLVPEVYSRTQSSWSDHVDLVRLEGGLDPYWMGRGDDLTASALLSEKRLKCISTDLATDRLYVGIPSRLTIYFGSNMNDIAHFTGEAYEEAIANGEPCLTSDLLIVENGRLIGMRKNSCSRSHETDNRNVSKERPICHVRNIHGEAVFVMDSIVAPDSDELNSRVSYELDMVLDDICTLDFSGLVLIGVRCGSPVTTGLQNLFRSLSERFTAVCTSANLQSRNGHSIRIQFVSEDSLK